MVMILDSYFIPYTNGGGTLVDWDFTNPIHCLNWYADGIGYAHNIVYLGIENKKQIRKTIKMHRFLLNFPKNEVDHINGIRNDNRLSNLKPVTRRQNHQNEKQHRNGKLVGAQFRKDRNKWITQFNLNGKLKQIGSFNTELEAHEAYMNYVGGL
jgi:hypothetical protein